MGLAGRLRLITALVVLAGVGAASPAATAASWSKPSQIAGVKRLRAVSCVSRSFCMAVGRGQAVAYTGGRWGSPQTIDPSRDYVHGLNTVSCASSTFCVAGDYQGDALVYNGTSWSAPTSITNNLLSQLSCAATTFCVALDGNGDAHVYNGSSWSAQQPTGDYPNVISCPSVGFCVAMVINQALRLSGGTWSDAGFIGPSEPSGGSEPNAASAISCTGRHFCAALDDFGDAFTWDGSRWSRLHRFDRNLIGGSDAVSCPTRRSCTAVDGNGFAVSWNGTRWSPKRRIDRPRAQPNDVSCPSARFCVAIDGRGRALIYG